MSHQCRKEECIKEWYSYNKFVAPAGLIIRYRNNNDTDGQTLTHCKLDECHSFYWKGKYNGMCDICFLEVCIVCQCETGETVDPYYNLWHCDNCRKRVKSNF